VKEFEGRKKAFESEREEYKAQAFCKTNGEFQIRRETV